MRTKHNTRRLITIVLLNERTIRLSLGSNLTGLQILTEFPFKLRDTVCYIRRNQRLPYDVDI